jgi:glycosyltransferase involved in cell wall biosynthesis
VRVHQIGFGVIPGDAITNHMVEIDKRLKAWGFETAMYAQHIALEMAGLARPDYEYVAHLREPQHLLIYHYGLYSPSVRYFQATRGRRLLIYHNITPARYYRGWSREQEMLCEVGRRMLPALSGCDLALGDSEFNRCELVESGFDPDRTGVLPVFLSQADLEGIPVNQSLLRRLRDQGVVNFLSVGRIVPSKAIEDLIRIFYVYQHAINPKSHLYLVGSRYVETYDRQLDTLVDALGLQDSVHFTGLVSLSDLKTYYQAAHLYLHASHHEGFCVPLLESMYFGVPILARKAAAVPETLGAAGVLFTKLQYAEIAEMADLMVSDHGLREQVIRTQQERLLQLGPSQAEAALQQALARLGLL